MFEIRFAVRLFVCFVSFEAIQAQSGNDFTPPTIKDCPSNIVKFLEVGSYETVSWTVPSATDESGPVTLDSQPIVFPGSFFKVDEPVQIDYTFSDQYGNKASCIFTVSVRRSSSGDTSAPIISDPCSSTPCMNGRCQPAILNGGFTCTCNTGFTGDQCQTPTTTSPCLASPCLNNGQCVPIDDVGGSSFLCFCLPGFTGDRCQDDGSSPGGTGTVLPMIEDCPDDITEYLSPDAGNFISVSWSEPTASDATGPAELVFQSYRPGNFFQVDVPVEVIYTFVYSSGNEDTCRFTVSVRRRDTEQQDLTAPIIIDCPDESISVTASPSSNSAIVTWKEPTATDDFDEAPRQSRSHPPGSTFFEGTTVVTYRFTDDSGNSDTCQFDVIVSATTSPCLASPCLNNGQCVPLDDVGGSSFLCFCLPGFTGDRCQDDATSPCLPSTCLNNGQCVPIEDGVGGSAFLCFCLPGFTGDRCQDDGSSASDNTPLTIEGCPSDKTEYLSPDAGNFMTVSWEEPTVMDASGSAYLKSQSSTSGNFFQVDVPTIVKYTFVDSAGNEAICSFTVSVKRPGPDDKDSSPPVITGCPVDDIRITASPGSNSVTVNWTEPRAIDDSGEAPRRIRSHTPGSTFNVGTTEVTYRFTDQSGNSDICEFEVIVMDSVADPSPCSSNPCLNNGRCDTIGNNVAYMCACVNGYTGNRCAYPHPGACSSSPCLNQGVCQPIMNGVLYNCRCADRFTGGRCELEISDTTPPSVSNCPDDIRDSLDAFPTKSVFWSEPIGRESSGATIVPTQNYRPGMNFNLGETTVEYIFAANGQTSRCVFTVTITDTTPPTLLRCPSSISHPMSINDTGVDIIWDPPLARDNSELPMDMKQSHQSGSMFTLGTHYVTYNFTDSNANMATCRFEVNIIPDAPNPCSTRPCKDQFLCFYRRGHDSYICRPNLGVTGRRRRRNAIDDYPCKNGGSFIERNPGSFCLCTQDYTGIVCETKISNINDVQ